MPQLFSILIFLFASAVQIQHSPEASGLWSGAIYLPDTELGISITLEFSYGELDGTIDIPVQQAYNLPLEVTEASGSKLVFHFETGTGQAVFYGELSDDINTIEGEFEQMGQRFPFRVMRRNLIGGRSPDLPESEMIIPVSSGQVSGNLILTKDPSPLVLLLSGSGSQDRDENVAGFRVFGVLSSLLYEEGYSSFRFDDRGIGQSSGDADATLFELAEDVADIADYLRAVYDERISGIYLLGHSQGGLVATIAAGKMEAAGILLMGTPFLRGDQIINMQIELISQEMNVPEAVVEQNLEFQERIYEVVRSEGSWEEIELDLQERLVQQLNQLPEQQRNALGDMSSFIQSQVSRQLSAAKSRWFKSLIEFEPSDAIRNIHIPVIAIFGEKDMQIPFQENVEMAETLANENGLYLTTAVIPGANHLFQEANTGMPSEYGMLDRAFAKGFIQTISEWLQHISASKN